MKLTTFNISSGCKSGTKIIVRVYNSSGNILATSSEYSYTKNENINYGDLTF